MWSVRFKWLYAIFLVVFTAVMVPGIFLAASTQPQQVPRYVFLWVFTSAGVLLWWYIKGKQAER